MEVIYIMQWPIYLTISNLIHKIQKSQIKVRKNIVGLIYIYKKDFSKVKIKLYYLTLKKTINYRLNFGVLQKVILLNVILLEKKAVAELLIISANRNI